MPASSSRTEATVARPKSNKSGTQPTSIFFEKEFPELLNHDFTANDVKHGVVHHINIKPGEKPCHYKARPIGPDKESGKTAWFELLDAGIIRRSESTWATPLHLQKKPNGGWRPCGDYRFLNKKTVLDRYPIKYLRSFTSQLHGKKSSARST